MADISEHCLRIAVCSRKIWPDQVSLNGLSLSLRLVWTLRANLIFITDLADSGKSKSVSHMLQELQYLDQVDVLRSLPYVSQP